jgi:hypothetical protein
MDNLSSLLKKENVSELILVVLFIIYVIMGYEIPSFIANIVDTIPGKLMIFIIVVYIFLHSSIILAVIALFVAYDLIRKSSMATGINALKKYEPSEKKQFSQFTAFNQFPYTLEQEVVAKMAPITKSGSSLTPASYKPMLDNTYDATPLNNMN